MSSHIKLIEALFDPLTEERDKENDILLKEFEAKMQLQRSTAKSSIAWKVLE